MDATFDAPLTERQEEVLELIVDCDRAGYMPTVREIGKALGISSPQGVRVHLKALVKKGAITITPKIARGIRLVKRPDSCQWSHDSEHCKWDTSCGTAFEFEVDGPKENDFRFCPYCGSEIKESRVN